MRTAAASGGPQCVEAQQVGEPAGVHAVGLRGLQEPDQLEPVQALGAGLVRVNLGSRAYTGRVGRDKPVDWANRKNRRTPCIIVLTEDGISPPSPRWRM